MKERVIELLIQLIQKEPCLFRYEPENSVRDSYITNTAIRAGLNVYIYFKVFTKHRVVITIGMGNDLKKVSFLIDKAKDLKSFNIISSLRNNLMKKNDDTTCKAIIASLEQNLKWNE